MQPKTLSLILSTALLLPAPLAAQGSAHDAELPQLVQEVFLAELVYPQQRGDVQLTAHSRFEGGAHTRLLGEYGITDRLQLSLVSPVLEGNAGGEEDVWEPGVLYALLPNDSPVALSVAVDVSLGHDSGPHWEPSLIAARRFGRVQLHGSVSTELDDPGDEVTGALAALLDEGRLTPTLEAVWSGSDDDFIVPGLFVHLKHEIEAGVGVPLCGGCGSSPLQVRAMVTVEF